MKKLVLCFLLFLCFCPAFSKSDSESISKVLIQEAKSGNSRSQALLAMAYLENPTTYKDGAKWANKSAGQGDMVGAFIMATCHKKGLGVGVNNPIADQIFTASFTVLHLSEAMGYKVESYCLGNCYENGYGTDQDYAKAVKCYQFSAEKGFAQAQYRLGVCYENGTGVEQSYSEAAKWYSLAAEQSYAKAQYALGLLYLSGKGVGKDESTGIMWLKKVAESKSAVTLSAKDKLKDLNAK